MTAIFTAQTFWQSIAYNVQFLNNKIEQNVLLHVSEIWKKMLAKM